MAEVEALARAVIARQRKALAKAITLIESENAADWVAAEELLERLLPHAGASVRIGISGIPGVGKSTLIEALGMHWLRKGARIAVLAVDPSSGLSGGSVLGDKTRMEKLSAESNSFIRPSPARGHLGGVSRRTREAIIACEAAGHDRILVETVGVGQSEAVVASLVDVFLLLQMPHTGDELQTFKKGVLELADIVAVTKADGITQDAARRTQADHKGAVAVPVLTVSGLTGEGVPDLATTLETFIAESRAAGQFESRRKAQVGQWLDEELAGSLLPLLKGRDEFQRPYRAARSRVEGQGLLPRRAVRQIFSEMFGS